MTDGTDITDDESGNLDGASRAIVRVISLSNTIVISLFNTTCHITIIFDMLQLTYYITYQTAACVEPDSICLHNYTYNALQHVTSATAGNQWWTPHPASTFQLYIDPVPPRTDTIDKRQSIACINLHAAGDALRWLLHSTRGYLPILISLQNNHYITLTNTVDCSISKIATVCPLPHKEFGSFLSKSYLFSNSFAGLITEEFVRPIAINFVISL